jgi:hypothetical protein
MREIRHFVGWSCKGFEEELFALFTAIEAYQSPKETAYSSNLGSKGRRELRRLSCSLTMTRPAAMLSVAESKEVCVWLL